MQKTIPDSELSLNSSLPVGDTRNLKTAQNLEILVKEYFFCHHSSQQLSFGTVLGKNLFFVSTENSFVALDIIYQQWAKGG